MVPSFKNTALIFLEILFLLYLALISNHIEHMLLHKANSAIQIFVLARDQALFKALFFAGDLGVDSID